MNSLKEKTFKVQNEGRRLIEDLKNKKQNHEKIDLKDNKVLYSGIHNLGNTCYMNAILQCLLHTKELIKYLDQYSAEFDHNKLEITQSFYELYDTYYGKKDKEYIIPEKFRNIIIKKHIQFDNKDQHDSHEFLTFILDNLITESEKLDLDRNSSENDNSYKASPLSRMFFGTLNSTIKCLKCNENNTCTKESFSTLGLSIPVEFKLFVYFVPLKSGPTYKMFIRITDNMYLNSLLELVSNTINYEIKSAIYYTVLNDELKKIFESNERVINILNKSVFLFIMEKDEGSSNKKVYFPINFCSYDEDMDIDLEYLEDIKILKVMSFPRVFSFDFNEKISNIFNSISNYTQYYIEKNDYVLLVKSNKNLISKRFECVFCNKYRNMIFYCGCLKNLNFNKIVLLKKYVNNQFFQVGISVEFFIVSKKKRLKLKELNVCKDYTNKPFPESKVDLYQLMNFFTEEEILEDKIYCNSCENPEYFTKKIEYGEFPNVLMISLKRFQFNQNNNLKKKKRREKLLFNSPEKNTYFIDFPIHDFDISKYSNDPNGKYELFAVCYHHGKINSGHYTAVCKINENWYEFNDKIMKEFNEENIVNSDAYILFYHHIQNGRAKI